MNIRLRNDIWCLLYTILLLTSGFLKPVIAKDLDSGFLINSTKNYNPEFETEANNQFEYGEENQAPQFFDSSLGNDFSAERKERDLPDYGDYQLEKDLPDLGKAELRLFSWWRSSDGGKNKKVPPNKIHSYPTNRLLGPDTLSTVVSPQSPSPKANASTTLASNTTASGRESAANMSTNATSVNNASTSATTASTYLTTCYTITESCLPLLTLVAAPICTEGSITSTISSNTTANATKSNVTSTVAGQVTQSSLNVTGTSAPQRSTGKSSNSTQAVVQFAHQVLPDSISMVNGSMVIPVYQMPSVTQVILLNTPGVNELPPSIIMNEVGTELYTDALKVYPDSTENINIDETNVLSKKMQLKSKTQFVNTVSPSTDHQQINFPEDKYFNNAFLHKIPEDKISFTQTHLNLNSNSVTRSQDTDPHVTAADQMERITSNYQLHRLHGFKNNVHQGNAHDIKFHSLDYMVIQKTPSREITNIHKFPNEEITNKTSQITSDEYFKGQTHPLKLEVNPIQMISNNSEGERQVNNLDNIIHSSDINSKFTLNQENYGNKIVHNCSDIDTNAKAEQNIHSVSNNLSTHSQQEERNQLHLKVNPKNELKIENNKDNHFKYLDKNVLGSSEKTGLSYAYVNDTNKIEELRNELLELKKDSIHNEKTFQGEKWLKDPHTIINPFVGHFSNSSNQHLIEQNMGITSNYKDNNKKQSGTNDPDSYKTLNKIGQIHNENSNLSNNQLKLTSFHAGGQESIPHVTSNTYSNEENNNFLLEDTNERHKFSSREKQPMASNNNGLIQNTLSMSTTSSEITFLGNLGNDKLTGIEYQKPDAQNSPINQQHDISVGSHFKYNDTFLSKHSTSGQNLLELCKNITCKGNDYLAQCCGSRICAPGKCQGEDFSYLLPIPGDVTTTSAKPCKDCRQKNNVTLFSLNPIGNNFGSSGAGNNLSLRVTRENSMNDFIKFQLMHGITAPDGKDLMNALKEAKYQMDKVSKEFHSDSESKAATDAKQTPHLQNQILSKIFSRDTPSIIDTNKILENLRTTMTDSLLQSKLRRPPIQINRFRPIRNQDFIESEGIQESSILNKLRAETDAELKRIFELEKRHKQEQELFNREREENLKELKGIQELISKEYESHKMPDLKRRDILNFPENAPKINNEEYKNKHGTYSKLVNEIENSDNNKDKKDFIFDRYSEMKLNASQYHEPQSETVGILLGENIFPELDSQISKVKNKIFPSLEKKESDNAITFIDNIRIKREDLKGENTKDNIFSPDEYVKTNKDDNLVQHFNSLHSDLFDLQRFVASKIIDKEPSPRQVKLVNANKNNNASSYFMDSPILNNE